MAIKKSELYSSLWSSCDWAPGGHGCFTVQGLHPHATVREVRLRQVIPTGSGNWWTSSCRSGDTTGTCSTRHRSATRPGYT